MTDQAPGSSGERPDEPRTQADDQAAGDASHVSGAPQSAPLDQSGAPAQGDSAQQAAEAGQAQAHPGAGTVQHGAPVEGGSAYQPHAGGQPGSAQHGHAAPSPWSAQANQQQYGHPGHPGQTPPQGQHFAQEPGAQYHYAPQFQPMNPVATRSTASRSNRTMIGVVALALVAALVGGGVGGFVGFQLGGGSRPGPTALDQPRPARSASTAPAGSVQQVAERVLPSVVQLQVRSSQGSGEGSGIVISQDGYILTNNHVAEGAQGGEMTASFNDNRTAPVKVVGTDPNSDLAVVKADITGLTPASIGRSDDLPVGAPVVAIGSPFGLSGTVTSGIISAKDRPVRAGGEQGSQASVLNALQTDAAINPGNSGGPLVDMDGNVVGINSAIYSPGSGQQQSGSVGLGFAIPIDQAQRTANELVQTGSATQTTLGVRITPADRPGAAVVQVVPGGAAEKAGIRPGELITKLDDRAIQDPDELIAAVRSHAPGQQVQVTTTDAGGGNQRTVAVTLAGEKG